MKVFPVLLDSRPPYFGDSIEPPSLLLMPMATGTLLGHVLEGLPAPLRRGLTVASVFEPTRDYEDAVRRTCAAVDHVVAAADLSGRLAYEPSDWLMMVDPRCFPAQGLPAEALLDGLGSGCSDNQFAQFNPNAIKPPTFGSVGMESGRNYMRGCATRNVDLSVVRRIRVTSSERYRAELRADVFNALNTVDINNRNASAQFTSPTNLTMVNSQFNADGSLNASRLTPRNAGFGAARGCEGGEAEGPAQEGAPEGSGDAHRSS